MAEELRALATACRQQFSDLESIYRKSSRDVGEPAKRFSRQSDRFAIWVADTEILLPNSSPETTYLESSPHVVEQTVALLDCLQETLSELHQLLDPKESEDRPQAAVSQETESEPVTGTYVLLQPFSFDQMSLPFL